MFDSFCMTFLKRILVGPFISYKEINTYVNEHFYRCLELNSKEIIFEIVLEQF